MAGIVGQGCRSKVKVKYQKSCVLASLLPCFEVKVQGQLSRVQRSILSDNVSNNRDDAGDRLLTCIQF